ncbi:SPW repeat-containing protein [Rhizobiales bacterium GAS113]|nr:SPW repeat-containing protein [Rhizobiales bacterium GAS113]
MFNTVTRNTEQKALDVVNLIAGLCLMLAPWALGFTAKTHAAWNAWIAGAATALVAAGALVAFNEWEEWANLVLGLWTVVAPWALSFAGTTSAATIHVIIGLIVAILAAVEIWFTHNRPLSTA